MISTRITASIALCLIAAGLAWGRKPGDPIKPGYNLYSREQDIQIGRVQVAQVRLHYQEVRDEFLETYIRRVGERLANTPEARESAFPFQFTLLHVPVVNAFALPGGPMFVFTGLVSSTENEAQLAGVMAHEMSHVILRHGTHELSKAKATGFVASLGAALGAAAAGSNAGVGQLSRMGAGLGENSMILHFSREAESEADLLGTHLMAEAGYDPMEMARFFEKLAATGNSGLQFFSDHPNPDNRERAIEVEIGGLPGRQYGYETGDFTPVKQAVAMLPPVRGPVTAGGALPGGSRQPLPPQVEPSGQWKPAHAQSFLVNFPANWQAYGNAAANAVLIAPSGGVTKMANGALDLGIGIVLNYYQPESKQLGLGTGTLSLVAHLHEQDSTIQLASAQQRRVRVDGSEGLINVLQATSKTLGVETNELLTVTRPEGLFYALAIAPQRMFPQLQQTFNQIMSSIRFGTAPVSGTPPPPNPATSTPPAAPTPNPQ
jgi:beta-barrel assembly-enhancing protease